MSEPRDAADRRDTDPRPTSGSRRDFLLFGGAAAAAAAAAATGAAGAAVAGGAIQLALDPRGDADADSAPSTIIVRSDSSDQVVDPREFGAIGDGVADDTLALQDTVAFLEGRGGGAISIAAGLRFRIPGGVAVMRNSTVPISILGTGGALVGGTLFVGPETPKRGGIDVSGMRIAGVVFDGDDPFGSRDLISLCGLRGLDIVDCVFRNGATGIATTGDGVFHAIAMLRISQCRFARLVFGIRHAASVWDYANDWDVSGCYFNYCSDTSIWIAGGDGSTGGIDGLLIHGNTMFSMGVGSVADPLWPSKRHNVRVARSDWLRITDNSLFEAGLDALTLVDARNFTIRGNQIAWPGQRERSAAIRIEASPRARGTIVGNNLEYWTQAAITFAGTRLDNVAVGDNGYAWSDTTDTWRGAGALTDPIRILADPACTGQLVVRGFRAQDSVVDSIRGGSSQSRSPLSRTTGVGAAAITVDVGGGEQRLFTATDMAGETAGAGGLVTVTAREADGGGAAAHYLLFVSVEGSVCSLVQAGGPVDGARRTDPSFAWSCRDGALWAAPVGETRGSFRFEAVGIGAVHLS